jgi:hypothetical protein
LLFIYDVANVGVMIQESLSVDVIENKKSCTDCKTTKTPLWRGGPAGPKVIFLSPKPFLLFILSDRFCVFFFSSCVFFIFWVTVSDYHSFYPYGVLILTHGS